MYGGCGTSGVLFLKGTFAWKVCRMCKSFVMVKNPAVFPKSKFWLYFTHSLFVDTMQQPGGKILASLFDL
jgi:hypothetical protein